MGLYEAAKDAANVLKEYGKVDEYQKILDLINALFEKNSETEKLKEDNIKLKERLKISGEYTFRNSSYWNKENNDGPFCTRCFDKHKDLIRIIPMSIGNNFATCPECKLDVNYTGKENYTHTRINNDNFNPYSAI